MQCCFSMALYILVQSCDGLGKYAAPVLCTCSSTRALQERRDVLFLADTFVMLGNVAPLDR